MTHQLKPHEQPRQLPPRSRQEQLPSQLPFNLLCCPNALPNTLHHLARLLPEPTTHTPFQQPLSLGPVLSPFLVLLATNPTLSLPPRIPISNPHTLIIQVTRSMPLSYTSNEHAQTMVRQVYSESRYLGMLTPPDSVEGQNREVTEERVKGNIFLEVEKAEAESLLRFPGCGGEGIGDGETWIRVEGCEKIWCEDCRFWWEFRAWARES